MLMWWWLWNNLLKSTCPSKNNLGASTCWSSTQARVTSAKSLSSLKFSKSQLCRSYWPNILSENMRNPPQNTTFLETGDGIRPGACSAPVPTLKSEIHIFANFSAGVFQDTGFWHLIILSGALVELSPVVDERKNALLSAVGSTLRVTILLAFW